MLDIFKQSLHLVKLLHDDVLSKKLYECVLFVLGSSLIVLCQIVQKSTKNQ